MNKRMYIGVLTGALLMSGCLDRPILTEPDSRWQVTVAATNAEIVTQNSAKVGHLLDHLDDYTTAFFAELREWEFDRNGFRDDPRGIMQHVDVVIGETNGAYGRWVFMYTIVIHPDASDYLAVYGHELVRLALWFGGEGGLAWQDSRDWSGLPGELWTMAENLALEFKEKP